MDGRDGGSAPVPRSLVWATDLDVLPADRVVARRDGYVVVRSPGNPTHYWGNLLLFDDPPRAGDAASWESLFDAEFGDDRGIGHRTFGWEPPGVLPDAAKEEFAERGYALQESIGLVAEPAQLRPHPRENREVVVHELDPAAGADEERWAEVLELQVAGRDEAEAEEHVRIFASVRLADRRDLFRAGRGGWYAAIDPATGQMAASCGVVVTGGRGRFQAVETAAAYRRRGICSRLVLEAGRAAARRHGAETFVIAADPEYHALGLYESLGFRRSERVSGYCNPTGRAATE